MIIILAIILAVILTAIYYFEHSEPRFARFELVSFFAVMFLISLGVISLLNYLKKFLILIFGS
jgi:hypothetical protein